jgi:hypothetical protein
MMHRQNLGNDDLDATAGRFGPLASIIDTPGRPSFATDRRRQQAAVETDRDEPRPRRSLVRLHCRNGVVRAIGATDRAESNGVSTGWGDRVRKVLIAS